MWPSDPRWKKDAMPFLEGGGLRDWTFLRELKAGEVSLKCLPPSSFDWATEPGTLFVSIRGPAVVGRKFPKSRRPRGFFGFLADGTTCQPSS